MAKDLSSQTWHTIPRKEIPWFPVIDAAKCIGCELCFLSCGREVFEPEKQKPYKSSVVRPYNCMVGCSTCSTVCPTQAISFPERDLIWNLERQHKIFKTVHNEAAVKKAKLSREELALEAARKVSETVSKITFEIAGEFGEKRFLKKLAESIIADPVDLVDLQLNVPTIKGGRENTPGFMTFTLTSTRMDDILKYAEKIRSLIKADGYIIINEVK